MDAKASLRKLYLEYEQIFEHAREEWEASRPPAGGRKSNYWQGKKDGLRIAMNLLHQLETELALQAEASMPAASQSEPAPAKE